MARRPLKLLRLKSDMKTKLALFGILILAFFLRFYKLSQFPPLNADEAAIGYNAYSLIQTGKDEHGNNWPIHFQSFNDYKPGLYFYLVIPFVKILGLNEAAVRIPAATLGVLTVLVVYFLVKAFSGKDELALASSLFLAISPWHIHFSRGGWEVNVATFFITLGVYLFIRAANLKKSFLPSFLFFVLSLYTYHAPRIIVPLLGLGFLFFYKREVFLNMKSFFISFFIAFLITIPLIIDFMGTAGLSRAAGVGLFADPGPLARINEQRGEHKNFSSLIPKIFHNKPVNYSLAFLANWGEHFWGEFLFLSGDEIQRNKVPETGQLFMLDFVFVVIGLIVTAKKPQAFRVILFWLVIAPLAAALTFQSPHALRSQNMVIPITIISACGFITIIKYAQNKLASRTLLAFFYFLLAVVILWGFARYQIMYWVHLPKEYPYSSQYGVKELVSFLKTTGSNFQKIIVTNRYDQPYILFLFYLKYPPFKFQNNHELTPRDEYGFSTVREFDKYLFTRINYDEMRPLYPNSLLIGTDEEIPDEANIIKNIYFPNGQKAFRVVAN